MATGETGTIVRLSTRVTYRRHSDGAEVQCRIAIADMFHDGRPEDPWAQPPYDYDGD